jgi:hypothetical protein
MPLPRARLTEGAGKVGVSCHEAPPGVQ